MEEEAASTAISWLSTTNYRGAAIITDSQSMLLKTAQGLLKPEWLQNINKSRLQCLKWIFTPGHAGVIGNERADRLAGGAVVGGQLTMGEADVLRALSINATDSEREAGETVERLRELGINRGAAATSRLTGPTRRCWNQHLTGTVSERTLKTLLTWKTEQVWSCPDCCEVDSGSK